MRSRPDKTADCYFILLMVSMEMGNLEQEIKYKLM